MPATTSATMKATISAKAAPKRRASASVAGQVTVAVVVRHARITAAGASGAQKKARDPGQGGAARADERGISKVSESLSPRPPPV